MSLKTKALNTLSAVGASALSVAAYSATYDSNDIAPATIDGIVTIIAIFVSFAALIGLVILYRWFKKNM